MTNAGSVLVHVGADLGNFTRNMARAQGTLGGFGKAAARAMVGVGAAAGVVGIMSLKAAGDFEQSLNVFQAVSKSTGTQMKQVSQLAKQLGKDVTLPATSAKDAALAMTELAKGGLSVTDTMKAAKGVLQLSAAAQIENAEAATITARALKAFKLSGDKAVKVADVLANAANASTGEISDFALGLQQSSAVAKSWGLTINQTTAALMQLADAGVVGSDAGTSLKTMLQSLVPQSKNARAAMEELGVHTFDATGKFVGIRSVVEQFSKGLKDMTQEQQLATLKTIFGSDAVRAANILLKEGVGEHDRYVKATERHGAAADLAAAKTKGFKGSLEAFKSSVETLQIELGEKLLPAATRVMGALTGLAGASSQVGSLFQNSFVAPVSAGAAAMVAFIGTASLVASAITKIKLAIASLMATNPVLLGLAIAVGLAAAAFVALRNRGDDAARAVDGLKAALDRLKPSADNAATADLNLAEAKNRQRAAALSLTSALRTQEAALAAGGKASFEYKLATNAVEAAQLGLTRANREVQADTKKSIALHENATKVQTINKNSVASLTKEYQGLIATKPKLVGLLNHEAEAQKRVTEAFERSSAKKYAEEMRDLGARASKTAKELAETHPALAKIAQGVAKAAEAKAKLALELGKIPSAVDSVKGPATASARGIGTGISGGIVAGSAGLGNRLATQLDRQISSALAQIEAKYEIRSPSKRTEREIGKPFGEGIVVGIVGALKAGASATAKELLALDKQLAGIQDRRAAQDRARAVAEAQSALADARKKGEGVAQAEQDLARAREDIAISAMEKRAERLRQVHEKENARIQAVTEKLKAQASAAAEKLARVLEKARDRASSAFETMQSKILRGFDAGTSGHRTGSESTLDQIRARREQEDLARAVTDAERTLREARESGDQDAVAEAEIRLARAREDVTISSLEKTAASERTTWEQQREALRESLEGRLTTLKTALTTEGSTWSSAMESIKTVLEGYGLDFETLGGLLGSDFVNGLKAAIGMAATSSSGIKAGSGSPMSHRQMETLADSRGATVVANVTVQGNLIHERELESVIVDAVRSYSRTNGPVFSRTAGVAV